MSRHALPMPDHPHILEARRAADETAFNFGTAWHSDWRFQEAPPTAMILHAKVAPPVGDRMRQRLFPPRATMATFAPARLPTCASSGVA